MFCVFFLVATVRNCLSEIAPSNKRSKCRKCIFWLMAKAQQGGRRGFSRVSVSGEIMTDVQNKRKKQLAYS